MPTLFKPVATLVALMSLLSCTSPGPKPGSGAPILTLENADKVTNPGANPGASGC